MIFHKMNTSGERDRSREESGSEEDPLTKTSPPGISYRHHPHHHHHDDAGPLGLHGWPAHPAFTATPLPPAQPNLSTLNKITSQFWGFDPSRPPTMPPHPLDSLSFPLSFPSLSSHLFKLPPADADNSRQMFRFRNSTWSNLSHYTHAKCLISLTICLIYNLYQVLVNFSSYRVIFHIFSPPPASGQC